ncbi:hypothetical protein [Citrobacter freundii]|uniref:hypothetical protein n=1 Tax=Citrobacter freundii TaxID=546 RepID=UPI001F201F36|nr:hypothetical protein [Citrobacter freundii]
MQTINNRMTETQIADLFSLAVQLQVKAEESDDRDTAILAYSIQNACSNLTESQREFRAADATIHNLELKITEMAVQLANAESKCRELAAENGFLKISESDLDLMCAEMSEDGWESVLTKTPATDAFLAEVRAQGVEMYADNLDRGADDAERDGFDDAVKFLRSEASGVRLFAAQLRKGVQS